jgi:phage terminase large subunit-like protein
VADGLGPFARFCSALVLEKGRSLTLEEFQRVLLADYFDGVTETLVLLSKKNGKTTLLSALALYHVCTTPDAECVIGAASRDQATILYDQAVGFISRSAGLQDRLVAKRGYREIRSRRDAGRIRVLAADVDTADGVIPTLALVDELHRHRSADLYGVFRDGLGPRDGQMVTISTAGDHERSALGQMRSAARRLRGLKR